MSAGSEPHPFETPATETPTTGDDVDRIVLAWRRERPDLDVEPLHVLSRISRIAKEHARMRTTAFAAHGLDGWEFDVLAALRRAGFTVGADPDSEGLLTATTVLRAT